MYELVVLGGDTPFALPLILDLEKKGYIVIASVSTPEAVDALEQRCQGYVRALVLNPHEVVSYHIFLSVILSHSTSDSLRQSRSLSGLCPQHSLANSPSLHQETHSHLRHHIRTSIQSSLC